MIKLINFEALILDMDGVFADTEPIFFEAFQALLKPHGVHLSTEYLYSMVGHSAHDNFNQISKDFGLLLDAKEYAKKLENQYTSLLKKRRIQANPGLWSVINVVKTEGLRLGLCTSSSAAQADALIKQVLTTDNPGYAFEDLFDAFVTGDDVKEKKPSAEPYLKSASLLAKSPQECQVIEDSVAGIKSAKRAGCFCFALKTVYNQYENLTLADKIIESMEALIDDPVKIG